MRSKTRVLLLAVLAAGVLLAAGCGGGDDDTPAATEWADSVCSAMSTWIESVSSATESIGEGGLSQEGLETAVDDVREASETLADDLQDAGRPDTDAGQEAEALLDGLADDLDQNRQELESAVEGVSDPERRPERDLADHRDALDTGRAGRKRLRAARAARRRG